MKLDQETQVHERLVEATRTVREWAGSDASRAMIVMLDNLAQSYLLDLVSVNTDGLVALQSALKQVYAIRQVLDNDGLDLPKI